MIKLGDLLLNAETNTNAIGALGPVYSQSQRWRPVYENDHNANLWFFCLSG